MVAIFVAFAFVCAARNIVLKDNPNRQHFPLNGNSSGRLALDVAATKALLNLSNNRKFQYASWQPTQTFSLVFGKIPKCSSSTAAGVIRVIGYRRGAIQDIDMGGNALTVDAARSKGKNWTHLFEQPFVLATHGAGSKWGTGNHLYKVSQGLPSANTEAAIASTN